MSLRADYVTAGSFQAGDLTSYRNILKDQELAFDVFLTALVLPGQADGWHTPDLTGWPALRIASEIRLPSFCTRMVLSK